MKQGLQLVECGIIGMAWYGPDWTWYIAARKSTYIIISADGLR